MFLFGSHDLGLNGVGTLSMFESETWDARPVEIGVTASSHAELRLQGRGLRAPLLSDWASGSASGGTESGALHSGAARPWAANQGCRSIS